MQLLKISFLLFLSISLYSFAFNTKAKKESVDEQLYKEFLSKFKSVKLPATIALKHKGDVPEGQLEFDMTEEDKKRDLTPVYSDIIPEIAQAMVSRTSETTFTAEALLAGASTVYDAVIYSTSETYGYNLKHYVLATFDKKGNRISYKNLGSARGKYELKFEASTSLAIVVKELEPSKTSSGKYAVTNTTNLSITSKGDIVAVDSKSNSSTKNSSTKTKTKTSTTPAVKG